MRGEIRGEIRREDDVGWVGEGRGGEGKGERRVDFLLASALFYSVLLSACRNVGGWQK